MRLPPRIKWSHVRRFYEAVERYLKASPVKTHMPDDGKVLILSPHIDDDIIGCGGTLCKHIERGDEVFSVYIADCAEERIKEASEAAKIIGLNRLEFMEYESKTLLEKKELPERLSKIIKDYKPRTIYLPSLLDRHNDHIAVNHHLCTFYEKHKYDCTICAFEVWTPLFPNLIIDITSSMDKKRNAVLKYKSQLKSNNWVDAVVSLNRFRAITSGAGQYAEGFIRYSLKEYHRLWKEVYAK
jgi:LmbE family N-acetylglucosaminyl deacetylase